MPAVVQLEPGSLFAGDFRVVRRLGAGGMGTLYVVEQLSTHAQRALKLMQPELVPDARLRKRFEQEATVGARIESDHVVKVLGAGVDATTETPWLIMELLEGEDLASYVQRTGAMPRADVLRVFEQLCHAVSAAHSANIVHRDLKPENVFLARSRIVGVPWIVKVLDFGIAKVASEAKTSDTATIGSPMWMAPEQGTRGEAVTPQTDVWALGLIAFYLLTGASFWNGARDDTTNLMMLMREIMVDPIPAASDRAREAGRADVLPQGFDAWMARCVIREPAQRFAHAGQLLDALVPLLGARPATGTMPMPSQGASEGSTPLAAAHSLNVAEPTPVVPSTSAKRTLAWVGALAVIALGAFVVTRAVRRPPPTVATSEGSPPVPIAALETTQAPPQEPAAPSSAGWSDAVMPPVAPQGFVNRPASRTPSAARSASAKSDAHPVAGETAAVAEPPASEATTSTSGTEGAGLDRTAANVAMASARSAAKSCRRSEDPPGEARVVVTFAPTGRVVDAHLEGPPFAGTPTGHCISAQFRALTVSPFSGPPVTLRRRFPVE